MEWEYGSGLSTWVKRSQLYNQDFVFLTAVYIGTAYSLSVSLIINVFKCQAPSASGEPACYLKSHTEGSSVPAFFGSAYKGSKGGVMTCLPYSRNARSLLKKRAYVSIFLPLVPTKDLLPLKTVALAALCCKAAPLRPFLTGSCVSICSQPFALMPHSWLFSFHLNTFPFNAFLLTLIHLLSLGRLRHGLFELRVLIVVGNLMPRDSLFSSPLLSSLLHPGGVLNGNTLLWITQQGAPWLIALLTIY